jgi:hypothetical protein
MRRTGSREGRRGRTRKGREKKSACWTKEKLAQRFRSSHIIRSAPLSEGEGCMYLNSSRLPRFLRHQNAICPGTPTDVKTGRGVSLVVKVL